MFGFLEQLGFRLTVEDHGYRYVCENLEVDIYWSPQRLERGVSVNRGNEIAYEVLDLARADLAKEAQERIEALQWKEESDYFRAFFRERALLLEAFVKKIMRDPGAFEEATARLDKANDDRWRTHEGRELLSRADQAFRKKDYTRAAEFYGQVSQPLSDAAAARFAYARKRRNVFRLFRPKT